MELTFIRLVFTLPCRLWRGYLQQIMSAFQGSGVDGGHDEDWFAGWERSIRASGEGSSGSRWCALKLHPPRTLLVCLLLLWGACRPDSACGVSQTQGRALYDAGLSNYKYFSPLATLGSDAWQGIRHTTTPRLSERP